MKKLATALALASGLVALHANAAPAFSLRGGYEGPIDIKFQNYENFSTGAPVPGAENFGILNVTSIERADGMTGTVWGTGDHGAEITGIFRDIIVQTVTPAGTGINVKSSGGLLDLYINPVNSLNAAGGPAQGLAGYTDAGCAPGDACYDGISNVAAGGLFLTLAFASGIDPTDPTITVDGDFDSATFPATGDASAYLNVTGGPYVLNFNTNGHATAFGLRDIFILNDICPNFAVGCASVGTLGDVLAWQLISDDPARGFFVAEPGSVALIGIALIGLAGLRRRIAA